MDEKPSFDDVKLLLSSNKGVLLVFSKETEVLFWLEGVKCKVLALLPLLLLVWAAATALLFNEEFPP